MHKNNNWFGTCKYQEKHGIRCNLTADFKMLIYFGNGSCFNTNLCPKHKQDSIAYWKSQGNVTNFLVFARSKNHQKSQVVFEYKAIQVWGGLGA